MPNCHPRQFSLKVSKKIPELSLPNGHNMWILATEFSYTLLGNNVFTLDLLFEEAWVDK